MRALVVDDNAAARELFAAQLGDMGFAVDTVAGGKEAVDTIMRPQSGEPYGLMVVDWSMPGMDGIETARRVRRISNPPHIIMATAYGRDELRSQAEQAGIEAFVVKPVSASAMVDALMTVLVPTARQAPKAAAALVQGDLLWGVRLLLAEDNEINQQIAIELLESAGAVVRVAGNGREALDILAMDEAFDAVLMDLQMPIMDGMEATLAIRADPRLAGVPVIAMTAHAMVEERERCMAAGMVDHITKPLDPPAMFRCLTRWVSARPRGKETTPASTAARRSARGADGPQIAGLDIEAGLQRVAGNRGLYERLLQQFATGQADAVSRIAAALAAGQRGEAERMAHTVRGVAGNIGLVAVQQAAAVLESALRDGRDAHAPLDALATVLHPTVRDLRAAQHETHTGNAPTPNDAPDPVAALASANRLAQLLATSDGEAGDFLMVHRQALHQVFGDGAFADIEQAVQGYDFDRALHAMQQAAAQRGMAISSAL